ncbi:hypothetical protein FO488_05525 [Geobacter sp. FeAm09]|uniref:hypothetical protein n=1 Tax=Geobacter sp. FeAm09 TaxID=2597769 RepID=UPI0011EE391A|nr:hypothetical protein [Geobacter sp. FeAm09]QEM67664.1 hypothetical protein FO488_05525 [Geobacter sp. FeAm09]
MEMHEEARKRIVELIATGDEVLATRRSPGTPAIGDFLIDPQSAYQWATDVQNLLVNLFGLESYYYRTFSYLIDRHLTFSPACRALDLLIAAKEAYESNGACADPPAFSS